MTEKENHFSWFERLKNLLMIEPRDKQQLLEVLQDARERDLLDRDALRMIQGVLRVQQMRVRDVMIPRGKMVVIEQNAKPIKALRNIITTAHSRFPVMTEKHDEVIGILLAKDILGYLHEKTNDQVAELNISKIMRPAIFIPESKRLDILLKEFRLNRNHMAIVVDEYGAVSGLITIEDVLEQIVGSIEDETDISEQKPDIKQITLNEYTVKALTPIKKFNEYFDIALQDMDCDTIGGYVMKICGHLPKRGESIEIQGLKLTVIMSNKRQVQLFRLIKSGNEESSK